MVLYVSRVTVQLAKVMESVKNSKHDFFLPKVLLASLLLAYFLSFIIVGIITTFGLNLICNFCQKNNKTFTAEYFKIRSEVRQEGGAVSQLLRPSSKLLERKKSYQWYGLSLHRIFFNNTASFVNNQSNPRQAGQAEPVFSCLTLVFPS